MLKTLSTNVATVKQILRHLEDRTLTPITIMSFSVVCGLEQFPGSYGVNSGLHTRSLRAGKVFLRQTFDPKCIKDSDKILWGTDINSLLFPL